MVFIIKGLLIGLVLAMIKLAYQEVKEKHFLKALLYFMLFIGFTILYGLVRKMTSIHAL